MFERVLSFLSLEHLAISSWTVLIACIFVIWFSWEYLKTRKKEAVVDSQSETSSGTVSGNVRNETKDETSKLVPVRKSTKKPDVTTFKKLKLKIFYGTQTGKAKNFAMILQDESVRRGYETEIVDLKTYEPEDDLDSEDYIDCVCVFIVSTYTDGTPPDGAQWFCKWLAESSTDFRVEKTLLRNIQYCVFGLGNSEYKEHYNVIAKNIDRQLHSLCGMRVMPLGLGDEDVVDSRHGGVEGDFKAWRKIFWRKAGAVLTGRIKLTPTVPGEKTKKKKCGGNCKCKKDGGKCSSDEEEEEAEEELYETTTEEESEGEEDVDSQQLSNGVLDLEDLGKVMNKMKTAKVQRKHEETAASNGGERKEMINPPLRKALEKQGYKLIGSHSGVKLCRWTKSMLRGRGGCYKHTFYGIESHRCMETTPSLACANKCVFCWRHHTNPVGTEWRWKMDDPDIIFQGALENHVNLIKQFKGVPGVKPERFEEGLQPQHCALSLVGEPIMYPEINKFVDLLHEKGISTFLVTNAQFPDAIRDMSPVTQLYVSVDASTKDSLKKIDRPLFKDFWERFLNSLKALSEKGQRTVYRLTLVKAFNTEELENYAQLVSYGNPDFIEIKGVTYCGDSKASNLTMSNVPWHEEVTGFVKQLADRLPNYELACEHEHSNCLLLAHKRFKINNEWWTWIDYPKFHQLVKDYNSSSGQKTFTSEDYMAKTPSWAVFGAREQGFDPVETRFFRKNKKDIGGC